METKYKVGDIIRHQKGTRYVILETPEKALIKALNSGWEPAYIYSSFNPGAETGIRYCRAQAEVEDETNYTFVRSVHADES